MKQLSRSDYLLVYKKVPKVVVGLVIQKDGKVWLQKKDGGWSLPNKVYGMERSVKEDVRQLVENLEADVLFLQPLEYLDLKEKGLDGGHEIWLVYGAEINEKGEDDDSGCWFDVLPDELEGAQKDLLMTHLGFWSEGGPGEVADYSHVKGKGRMPYEEFKYIYGLVPRFCVEAIPVMEKEVVREVLLTKRGIEPYKGYWHIPGGTVLKGETLEVALARVVEEELGCAVEVLQLLDPVVYRNMPGDDIDQVAVSLPYVVDIGDEAVVLNEQGEESQWFKEVPGKIVNEHVVLVEKVLRNQ